MENHIHQMHFTKSSAVCSATMMNPALHDFCSMLDGEMKHLNATGNYVNKQLATMLTQLATMLTSNEHSQLQLSKKTIWGLLGDYNADALLNTLVFEVGHYTELCRMLIQRLLVSNRR